jgi:erythromycin esterase
MGADDTAELDEAIDWLRSRAHEVSATEQRGDDFADLEWLRDAVGDARVVALGEATHGTHEFFAMKLRLLQFMVTELGFSAFAIEASWAQANLINQFVHTGQGDPYALLKGMGFWTWDTQEVLDLILWIRKHNQDAPPEQAVSFFGFDVQFPSMAVENVLGFLGRVDPPARTTAELRYARFREYLVRPAALPDDRATRRERLLDAGQRYVRLPGRAHRHVPQGLRSVQGDLERHRQRYIRASSAADFEFALRSARVVVQAEKFVNAPAPGRMKQLRLRAEALGRSLLRREWRLPEWGGRDDAMAENVAWLLERAGPDARMVLWAHDLHVMTIPGSMGAALRNRFHEELLVCAFAFHHGRFNACTIGQRPEEIGPPTPQRAPDPPGDSYEAALHSLGVPSFIVDLRDPNRAVPRWLRGPRPFRTVGSTYSEALASSFSLPMRLPRQSDMLVYFDESTPSHYLGTNGVESTEAAVEFSGNGEVRLGLGGSERPPPRLE